MIAAESGNQQNVLRTLVETIKACIEGDITVNNLTSFDIEYMFLQSGWFGDYGSKQTSRESLPCSS